MDDSSTDTDPLVARIHELENERDELRKDIEQLCTQQAGPSYLLLATRMHFQRTAGLEQEIMKLQKELAECTRERLNLREEVSEAHRIKIQLEKLHTAEVAKKLEAERQLKFFQGNIAAAFADRDNAFMEAEKAKEKEESMARKLQDCQRRLEELTSDASKAQDLVSRLQTDLAEHEEEHVLFKKIVDKFYLIKKQSSFDCEYENSSYLDKCSYLLDDPEEPWSLDAHREAANAECISALEQERDSLKESVVKFQNKIRMGLDIEGHLKRKVRELEKKKKSYDEFIKNEISRLRQYHSEQREFVVSLLNEGNSYLLSIVNALVQNFGPSMVLRHEISSLPDEKIEDVHMRIQTLLNVGTRNSTAVEVVDTSKFLSQALQEKVSALILLQQQEERHFLERNENSALLQRLGELQRNLNQVTAEKLEALMKLEHLERKLLMEQTNHESRLGRLPSNDKDRTLTTVVKEGRFKNLLKRTSLKLLAGASNFDSSESGFQSNSERYFSFRRSTNNTDAAWSMNLMKIENATLNESMRNLEQLTSQIYKLRNVLVKANESITLGNGANDRDLMRSIDNIISEANLVHTALSSSLPLSWSALGDEASSSDAISEKVVYDDSRVVKIESVSAAGIEMVQLLLLAAEILKDRAEQNS